VLIKLPVAAGADAKCEAPVRRSLRRDAAGRDALRGALRRLHSGDGGATSGPSAGGIARTAGKHLLRAYHQGDWSELPARYQEILAYAAQENLELYGYAYETGLNDAVAKSMADSITEILIPVRRK